MQQRINFCGGVRASGKRGYSRPLLFFVLIALVFVSCPLSTARAARDNVILDMDFTDVSGQIVKDASGNNNDATLKGGAVVRYDERFGKNVLELNGVDGYAEIAANSSLFMTNCQAFSMEMVFMAYEDNTYKTTMTLFNRAAARTEYYLDLANDEITFHIKVASSETYDFISTPYMPGKIYYVACTYDGSNIRMYLNGQLVKSKEATGEITHNVTVKPTIGASINGSANFFHGIIDSLSIQKSMLSQQEIENRFSSLQSRIDFNRQYEGVVEDFSVNVQLPEELPTKGDIVTAVIQLRNNTDSACNDVALDITHPYFAVPLNSTPSSVDVEAHSTKEVPISYKLLEGGRVPIIVKARLLSGESFTVSQGISVSGPGVYAGDCHTHSLHSDGAGSIFKNASLGQSAQNLSFIYATDHNVATQLADVMEVNAKSNGSFIAICGVEFTTYVGHVLHLGIDEALPVPESYLDGTAKRGDADFWQAQIDQVNSMGGSFYFAHPYQLPVFTFTDRALKAVRNHAGVEIWNGFDKANSRSTRHAIYAWESMNCQGTGRYNALANTDGHFILNIGQIQSRSYLPSLSEENIAYAVKKGSFVCTNGPELRFDIEGVPLAETYYVKEDGETAVFNIYGVNQHDYLTGVKIIRCSVTGEYDSNAEVVFEENLEGKQMHSYSAHIPLEVREGEFYRVELTSETSPRHFYINPTSPGGYSYTEDIGFAVTNNIWIGKADKSNSTQVHDITYVEDGFNVLRTDIGLRYLDMKGENFNLNKVLAVVDDDILVRKSFDDQTGLVTITLTAEDGTTRNQEFYVINYSSAHQIGDDVQPGNDSTSSDTSSSSSGAGDDSGNSSDTSKPGNAKTGESGLIQYIIMAFIISGAVVFILMLRGRKKLYG